MLNSTHINNREEKMATVHKTATHKRTAAFNSKKLHTASAANNLLREGRHLANGLYAGSLIKLNRAQKNMKGYSKDVLQTIRKKPVASVLIAGCVGFILSALLRR